MIAYFFLNNIIIGQYIHLITIEFNFIIAKSFQYHGQYQEG